MTDILEKAVSHFAQIKNAPRKAVPIPEWETTIFIKPLNLAEAAEIEAARAKSPRDGIIKTIVMRCVDEHGKRLFYSHHEKILAEEVSPEILSRIILQMAEPTPEQIEKLRDDAFLFAVFSLAEHLHKTVDEVFSMSASEFSGWMAYFSNKGRA